MYDYSQMDVHERERSILPYDSLIYSMYMHRNIIIIGKNMLVCGQRPFTIGDMTLICIDYKEHEGHEHIPYIIYVRGLDIGGYHMLRAIRGNRPLDIRRSTAKRGRSGLDGYIDGNVDASKDGHGDDPCVILIIYAGLSSACVFVGGYDQDVDICDTQHHDILMSLDSRHEKKHKKGLPKLRVILECNSILFILCIRSIMFEYFLRNKDILVSDTS